MKTLFKLFMIIAISLGMMQCKEKEPEPIIKKPIDYRDKWCGNYSFAIMESRHNIMNESYDTTFYDSGKVYYTDDMDEDEINIDITFFSNKNPIHIDKNGSFIFPQEERMSEKGCFVNNDSLYYFFSDWQAHGFSYSYKITGIKQ